MIEISYPYIMIDSNGVVQNVAMFSDYEKANKIVQAIYGDKAFAVEYCYSIRIGSIYKNDIFYNIDGEDEVEAVVIPTEDEKISRIKNENDELIVTLAEILGCNMYV